MRLTRLGLTVGLLALAAQPATAQLDYKFTAGSGVNAFGTQVGTYKAELDGKQIDVFCVDFLNHVSIGDKYQVYSTNLTGTPDLGKTRFGTYNMEPERYQMAAWLASQFYLRPTAEWGSIHAAIWHLTTPNNPNVGFPQSLEVSTWLGNASAEYGKYYYDNVYVLTDVAVANCAATNPGAAPWNGCGHQEHIFIEGGKLTMTPEPASMFLLATGLVGLGVAGFVRRRKEQRKK